MRQLKIPLNEVVSEVTGTVVEFPKYTTQIMNLANQNAGGTRPRVVGQLSELIQNIPEKSYQGWKSWYENNHAEKIDIAVNRVNEMVKNLKQAIELIDENMVREWIEDLMYTKTSEGFIYQEFILKYLSEKLNVKYRRSVSSEESKGIDGFVGETAISIKPSTYMNKKVFLAEKIEVKIVYYEKKGKNLLIFTDLV